MHDNRHQDRDSRFDFYRGAALVVACYLISGGILYLAWRLFETARAR